MFDIVCVVRLRQLAGLLRKLLLRRRRLPVVLEHRVVFVTCHQVRRRHAGVAALVALMRPAVVGFVGLRRER